MNAPKARSLHPDDAADSEEERRRRRQRGPRARVDEMIIVVGFRVDFRHQIRLLSAPRLIAPEDSYNHPKPGLPTGRRGSQPWNSPPLKLSAKPLERFSSIRPAVADRDRPRRLRLEKCVGKGHRVDVLEALVPLKRRIEEEHDRQLRRLMRIELLLAEAEATDLVEQAPALSGPTLYIACAETAWSARLTTLKKTVAVLPVRSVICGVSGSNSSRAPVRHWRRSAR